MSALVGIYGAGGCGRGIMPLARSQFGAAARLVFIDDGLADQTVNGHPVVAWDRFIREPADGKAACLAIADSQIREQLYESCAKAGVEVATVRAGNIVEMDDVEIGPGALISPFVTLTSNIRIGCCFQANLYSYVEHDCRIGDFVTFAPSVRCNGNVHIGNHAYIGTGAVIRQGTRDKPLLVGEGAIVGMGAVVTKDVAPGSVVVGNPARPMAQD
jgi:sugar O-acyltransferase (sialic acid O-acetyltransferase NeuD family)